MLRLGICFCQKGLMSSCTAAGHEEQKMCDFYSRHSIYDRCTNLNKSINNGCWSVDAQRFGYHPPENPADVEETVDLDSFLEEEVSCVDCIQYTCSYIIRENQLAEPRGGLNINDLRRIAANCDDFCDESMINDSIKQIQRGIKP